jgi:hypothetical protein
MANLGIMHAARSIGGEPLCRKRNAHMSTSIEIFRHYPTKCKKCEAKLVKQDAFNARLEKLKAKKKAKEMAQ